MYLSQRGDDVAVIDQDRERCEWISKNSDARVYNGNALDPELLMEAGMGKADALIVALGNDQLTRKVVDFTKSQFGVPKVIAIANESEMAEQIKADGADTVICSQDEVLAQLENVLQPGTSRTVYYDKQRSCQISRVIVRATSRALGKAASKLESKSARVSGIIRGETFMFPDPETTIEMGDEVFIMGREEAVEKTIREISEES